MKLKAPFPWFGGKSRVAAQVWERFGNVPNYVEPFFGSGAVLLGRPHAGGLETVNDKDGFVANFWRAIKTDPEKTAAFADNPVFENDLHARHSWLVAQKEDLVARLEGDAEFFDAKIAGWWAWGICCWIGGEFCSGIGPWVSIDGKLVKTGVAEDPERSRVHSTGKGLGIDRKRIEGNHLKGVTSVGVERRRVHTTYGQGVNRRLLAMGDSGKGLTAKIIAGGISRRRNRLGGFAESGVNASNDLKTWFLALRDRLIGVRVCCGDWSRVSGPSVTFKNALTGVFLDPPYSFEAERDMGLYRHDCGEVAKAVREWAVANGDNKLLRIALCGYEGEHEMPADWDCLAWKASKGYAGRNADNKNSTRERIWFSPHCLKAREPMLL